MDDHDSMDIGKESAATVWCMRLVMRLLNCEMLALSAAMRDLASDSAVLLPAPPLGFCCRK